MTNPPDERVVYLALRNTFKGADAQVRRPKKVRELVQKVQKRSDVRDLIREHNIDNVCNVARSLLEQQIFESTLKAKIRFPEVFQVSPAQTAERSASEAEAARSEANAIRILTEGERSNDTIPQSQDLLPAQNAPLDSVPHELPGPSGKRPSCYPVANVPSLYPVYLPFQTQHQLLVKVQGILERACHEFGMRAIKEAVEREGWDCPESAELNRWPRVLLLHKDNFLQGDLEALGKPLEQVLDSITQLRHTAVHRLRVSANRLEQFMVDAEALARLLQHDSCTRQLSRLRLDTQLTLGELKRYKDLLESNVTSKLRDIATQRAELDRLEEEAVQDMLREDKEYQRLAGMSLNQAMETPDTVLHSQAPTELDTKSDCDPDTDLERISSNEQDTDYRGGSSSKAAG
ncbi:hypothetical protein AYL99_10755 [Fonsecaea erecta]|uniref:Ubiquinol-cytochrome-c reductase cytochrome c1 n=1 Tax=Fonsecaea erecta TaxID=1367422 RepID=A0A178Z7N4_9EURO|nr:hypothetical protein AYL99_10755 [Fonsecaea erecta]OAP55055.1 hypothetical protein AYL99_10755 [Fonsecaea erecta]